MTYYNDMKETLDHSIIFGFLVFYLWWKGIKMQSTSFFVSFLNIAEQCGGLQPVN